MSEPGTDESCCQTPWLTTFVSWSSACSLDFVEGLIAVECCGPLQGRIELYQMRQCICSWLHFLPQMWSQANGGAHTLAQSYYLWVANWKLQHLSWDAFGASQVVWFLQISARFCIARSGSKCICFGITRGHPSLMYSITRGNLANLIVWINFKCLTRFQLLFRWDGFGERQTKLYSFDMFSWDREQEVYIFIQFHTKMRASQTHWPMTD